MKYMHTYINKYISSFFFFNTGGKQTALDLPLLLRDVGFCGVQFYKIKCEMWPGHDFS